MGLVKVRLGDYIEKSTVNNNSLQYGSELIVGVTNKGVFSEPKGDVGGVNLRPYKIVNDGAFVYNPSRLDLGSIAYRSEGLCIVSHLYVVFYLNEAGKKAINPTYLLAYFRRNEFYREVAFRNFGSQRPEFSFNDMCEIEIPLPELEIQNKFASIYEAMLANQQSYERGLEDLKLVCDGYIEELRRELPLQRIGDFIEMSEEKNGEFEFGLDDVKGVSIEKRLIDTKADMKGVSLKPYLLVEPDSFAYVPITSRNGEKITIALNGDEKTYICSSSYVVFKSKDRKTLLPEYLMLFFSRPEFDRYARFNSWGSAREAFVWDDMRDVEIPIPSIEKQRAIADVYSAYLERREINERLKAQLKDICPILIKGSIEEAIA